MPEPTLTPEQLADLLKVIDRMPISVKQREYVLGCVRIREGARVEEGSMLREDYVDGWLGLIWNGDKPKHDERIDMRVRRYTFVEPIQPAE